MQSLIAVCDEEIAAILQKKFLFINRRWKELFDLVRQFEHDDSIKKKCEEFYALSSNLLETLEKIDQEIQEYLPCTIKALKEQENRLYVSRKNELFVFVDLKMLFHSILFRKLNPDLIQLVKPFKNYPN